MIPEIGGKQSNPILPHENTDHAHFRPALQPPTNLPTHTGLGAVET